MGCFPCFLFFIFIPNVQISFSSRKKFRNAYEKGGYLKAICEVKLEENTDRAIRIGKKVIKNKKGY